MAKDCISFSKLSSIKRQRPKEGDIFVIDINSTPFKFYKHSPDSFRDEKDLYGYGRIIHITPTGEFIIELFDYIGHYIVQLETITKSSKIIKPLFVTGLCLIHAFWKIIYSDNDFDKTTWGLNDLKFVMPSLPNPKIWTANEKPYEITLADAKNYTPYTIYFPENIHKMIIEKHQNLGAPSDCPQA